MGRLLTRLTMVLLCGCAAPQWRGTGDLGLVIERASGQISLVDTNGRAPGAHVAGLVTRRTPRWFTGWAAATPTFPGRDGVTDESRSALAERIVGRVLQSGNAIGGAISQDGSIVAQNYTPEASRLLTPKRWNCSPKCSANTRRGD
ncbi:MAG: hypothetical protein IPL11_13760, partial [Candidatus Accumulibacter sp.]|nr:hypothetical protein [Accumulibacter sp.]